MKSVDWKNKKNKKEREREENEWRFYFFPSTSQMSIFSRINKINCWIKNSIIITFYILTTWIIQVDVN
jgi:hypothetical protein